MRVLLKNYGDVRIFYDRPFGYKRYHVEKVEKQRLLLEAEEWATGIRDIHIHSITSMWYETAESKAELLRNGPVTDTTFNNGLIERTRDDKLVCTFGLALTGDDLLDKYLINSNYGGYKV